MYKRPLNKLSLLLVGCAGCLTVNLTNPTPPPPNTGPCEEWDSPETIVNLEIKGLNEISGIVSSRKNPGVLWIHEDSGNTNQIFAINAKGSLLATVTLEGFTNIDWEDIAIGPCGEEDCLYLADTGDNLAVRDDVSILRVIEPVISPNTSLSLGLVPEQFFFSYPDGPQDTEGLAVTPEGLPLLVTKRTDGTAKVYLFPALDSAQSVVVTLLGVIDTGRGILELPAAATAADLLPDGSRLLVRTYLFGWEYRLPDGDLTRIEEAEIVKVPVRLEGQGEAIAYENALGGFWQIPEGEKPTLTYAACD